MANEKLQRISRMFDALSESALQFYEQKVLGMPEHYVKQDVPITLDRQYRDQSKLRSVYALLGMGMAGTAIFAGLNAIIECGYVCGNFASNLGNHISNLTEDMPQICRSNELSMNYHFLNEVGSIALAGFCAKISIKAKTRLETLIKKTEAYEQRHPSLQLERNN